jgi:NADH:ubiquinone oxidoreductase subunit E
MKGLRTAFSFALITFFMASTAQVSDGYFSNETLLNQQWLASQVYSAAFNDVSPGFDDLYVIKTQDKGREIVIYCNTTYCYKNRNAIMTS